MRIAQVSPLIERVPPKYYGGIERIVSYLTEELVSGGHDVTLFASGDSQTSARLVSVVNEAVRLGNLGDPLAYHLLMLEELAKREHEFDIVHCHLSFEHFALARRLQIPTVTTQHGRLDLTGTQAVFREFSDMPVVSISNDQRKPIPDANWVGTVYNALPDDLFTFNNTPANYLAFLGRASPEKGLHTAIEIAAAVGLDIKIASKVDRADQEYFDNRIKPLIKKPAVEFLGEISESAKNELLGNAIAMLFPIDWPEPFGLVMIEAMACGTPVIAFPRGAVPEVIDDGETGFLVKDAQSAIAAIGKINTISRRHCRDVFEQRFTVRTMTDDYLDVYQTVMETTR
jgi:glycosyltransferase involved in cell wall biosynthesis